MSVVVEFFVKRPLLVNLIIIAILVIGIRTVMKMPRESFPRLTFNRIIISTIYPGASSHDVEINVTTQVEKALEGVSGIREVISESKESVSIVTAFINDDADKYEFKKIYDDIDSAVSRISDLPKDIDGKPVITSISTDDLPIVEIAVSGSYNQLRTFIPYLEMNINKIKNVSKTIVIGLPDEEVQILIDPQRARRLNVDLKMIAGAIKLRNLEGSGGTLESFLTEKKIVSYSKFQKYTDVLQTNIRRSFVGYGVKLKDLAKLIVRPEDMKLTVRSNGKPGASVLVLKKPNTDQIDTVDAVKERVKNLKIPKNVEIRFINDQSFMARNRLSLLINNSIIGFIIVVGLLFIVFGRRIAFWAAFGIPFSFLGMFIVLPLFDVTLNAITLGGAIIMLGMLVDDAIVVAEQISVHLEEGHPPVRAAIMGVQKVWQPVVASCSTTVIAFSPILYFGGLPGKFIWVIPLIVALTLLFSIIESFFFLPAHLAHGKPIKASKKNFIKTLEKWYRIILMKAIRFRYVIIVVFAFLLISTVWLMKNVMKQDAFPQEGTEGFIIQTTLRGSVNRSKTQKVVIEIEKQLLELPKNELIGFSSRIGTHSKVAWTDRGTQNNLATIFVYLTPFAKRSRTAYQIMDHIRKKIKHNNDALIVMEVIRTGPPLGKPFEIRVAVNNDVERLKKTVEIKQYLSNIKGVFDINDDNLEGKRELNIKINHDMLAATGLTVEDLLMTLRIAYDGIIVTSITMPEKILNFRLRLNEKSRADLSFLGTLPIMNRRGYMIKLKKLVTIEERPSSAEIRHVDGRRTTVVFGQLDRRIISPDEINALVGKKFPSDEKMNISFSGEGVETKKIFENVRSAVLIAVIGTFLIITLIFNSLTRPFIVIACIPFGIVGIIWSLFFHGMPVSLFAMVALIGLTGIIVNDSIMMVYTIISLSKMSSVKGLAPEILIRGAVKRLRPILLTTITTVCGLLPTAYGIGGYDMMISPLCLSMAYGLLFGTLILLFLVPIIFQIGLDAGKLSKRIGLKRG